MTNDNRHSRGDGSASSANVSLNELSLKFHRLRQIYDDALSWQECAEIRPDWATKRSSVEQRMLVPIQEELVRLTWLAARTEASTAAEVRLKAQILLAGLDSTSTQHADALAQSLAKEVINLL